ncbi:MAG: tas [Microbacteriaceae bacterium]|jgi:aryl-alcohol dehydrogenase-like predicted oxidoreductase|nr:tas [Microbacteriaceae bacterium]
MKQVTLGTTGIQVSELFFGAGSIGGVGSSVTTRDAGMKTDEALERLDEAYELGVRVIDTANSYAGGESERVVGRWREEREHADVVVETKVGNVVERGQDGIDLTAGHIERQLALSRSRLGTVDLYLSHAPDPSTPLEATITAFAAAIDAGQIRAYGCSNLTVHDLEAVLLAADRAALPRPGWIQNEFSLAARSDERDLLPLAAGEGLGYTAYSPLAGGVLAGRYRFDEEPPEGSRLAIAPRMYVGAFTEKTLDAVTRLGAVARERDVSTAGLALWWLLRHPSVTAPIVSPRRTEQWDAVTEALALEPDDALFEQVGALFAP